MKNICIVNEHQIAESSGGVQTVSYILREKFEEHGYAVYSFHLEGNAKCNDKEYLLPDRKNIDSETNFKILYDRIKEHNISIILFQGHTTGLMNLCIGIRKELPIKLIYTFHRNPFASIKEYDDYKERILNNTKYFIGKIVNNFILELKRYVFNNKSKRQLRKMLSNYDMDYIDAFVSLDNEYTDYFKSIYPNKYEKKFHTIINPIKIIEYDKNFVKEKNILFIARHTYQKRLDRLLYIWKDIYKKFPEWKLVVVGDGDFHIQYKEIANSLYLENIEFTGWQAAQQFYKNCSIICMTSSHEGLPMTLIEAQLYGCVPIAYNSFGSASKIIVNNYNGILIKPFQQRSYSHELQKLMKNENRRTQMAENGMKFIRKFDINNIINAWTLLFEKI